LSSHREEEQQEYILVETRPRGEKEESSQTIQFSKEVRNWTDYKRTLTDYNKALRQAKRESWKRHCEEIEKVPECARLNKILSNDGPSAVSSIQLANGEYTTSEREILEELFRVHFLWFRNNHGTFWRMGRP